MEIKLNMINNLPIMPATLNGVMVKFLIDSGASSSILDSSVSRQYKFKIGSSADQISGIGGSRNMYNVTDACVKYRDVILTIPKLKTSDMKEIRNILGIVGILGSDFLNANKAVLDYYNKTLKLC